MSVATAITALSGRIQDAYTACEAKGATMPATRNSANLSATIDSIQGGGGGGPNLVAVNSNVPPGAGWFSDYITFLVDGVKMNQGEFKTNAQTVQINIDGDADNRISYVMSDGTTGSSSTTINLDGRSLFVTQWFVSCLLAGTKILLADGAEKNIEDITYDDSLMVWDFDNGCLTTSKPLWIKKSQTVDYMYEIKLASGNSINVTGPKGHRAFNTDESKFIYVNDSVGQKVKTIDGEDEVVSCEKKTGEFEFFNIITDRHFNMFANGILTSCRLNNYRKFDGMKFAESPKVYHAKDDFKGIPDSYIEGLRLCEQPIDVDELNAYVRRLLTNAK